MSQTSVVLDDGLPRLGTLVVPVPGVPAVTVLGALRSAGGLLPLVRAALGRVAGQVRPTLVTTHLQWIEGQLLVIGMNLAFTDGGGGILGRGVVD